MRSYVGAGRNQTGVGARAPRAGRRFSSGRTYTGVMGDLCVCHLVENLALGGLENQLLRIVRATDDPSISYVVCHAGSDTSRRSAFQEAGARMVDAGHAGALDAVRPRNLVRFARFLRAEGVDVLHCQGSLYQHVVGRVCGSAAGCPVVGTYHNRADSFHPATRMMERLTRPLSAVDVAVSKGVERSFAGSAREYEVGQDGLNRATYTIYNGIDVLAFESAVGDADPTSVAPDVAGDGGTVFLNVGRYSDVKNQAVLVDAMDRVVEELPAARLFVVGWGERESALRERVERHGLDDHVTVTGRVPSVTPYYALADAFVLPSLAEGLSVVLLEAMAAGLPIVASHIPGTTEAVADGDTGLLVPPDSVTELADAMVRMADEDRRARFGENGRNLVSDRFDVRRTTDAYLDVYRRLT